MRTFQYLPFWESAGYQVEISPFFNETYLSQVYSNTRPGIRNVLGCYWQRLTWIFKSPQYDIIWVEKEFFPFVPAWFEKFLSSLGKKIVVDYDDAVFHNYDLSRNFLVRTFLSRKIDHVMKSASLLVAGNSYIQSRAIQAGNLSVLVLPTVVDIKRYTQKQHGSGSVVRIGWIGSPSTLKYLSYIAPTLKELYQKHPFEFILINGQSTRYQQILDLPDSAVQLIPWTEEGEVEAIHQMDIGIMPLPDDLWEKGKCAYKLIQYMACGLPVVASPVGMNPEVVNHGQNGFLAGTEQEWVDYLSQLLKDSELRKQMGANGRKLIEEQFNLEKNFEKMEKAIRQLMD